MTRIAVVILNFNGREWLRQFLPFVVRFSGDATIIVADNHSSDDSVALVAKEFPTVGILGIPENLGFCGGYNFSLSKIEAEYYVLLNSDVEVTPGWLDPLVALLDSDPTIAAAQPKILSHAWRNYFEYAGAAGGFIDALGYPFCRGRLFTSFEEDHGQYNDTIPVFWATGACLFIRASVFHEMNGLDGDFFAHMEEIDLCWKLHRSGYKVYAVCTSQVYHVGGGTLSKSNPGKTFLNFRNGLSLVVHHMSASGLLWKLPLRFLLDWMAALVFLAHGQPRDCWAVYRAHAHFIVRLPSDLRKRKLKREQKWGIKGLIYPRSLVIDYFLLGRKRYSDLRF